MNNYEQAFTVTVQGQPLITPIEVKENEIRLRVNTLWTDPVQGFSISVVVPTATALRFSWDQGVYGHLIQMPGGAPHFCAPRLRHHGYETIAQLADRNLISEVDSPTLDVNGRPVYPFCLQKFWWENWFDRVHDAVRRGMVELAQSLRKPNQVLVRSYLQRSVNHLITGIPGVKHSGLPLTDDRLIVRQRFEVKLGYPDVPRDNWLYEQIKLKYLAYVDSGCDILMTGKNQTGRDVIRVRKEAPRSHVTKHPVSEFILATNPLSVYANPTRVCRENRSCQWLELVNPTPPPLTAGVPLPKSLAKCVTTVTIAIADLVGKNIFVADEEVVREYGDKVSLGETLALDGLLLCPTGAEKLRAVRTQRSEPIPASEFEALKEELAELPGFTYELINDPPVEILDDGTPIYTKNYRYWYERELFCRYDKVKLLVGGIKAVCRPIPQLWAKVGEETLPIDLVVSAHTIASKGAKDAILYALASLAGVTEIDPTWSIEELVNRIEGELAGKGLPIDGRFPILIETEDCKQRVSSTNKRLLGLGIVGHVPAVRANETELQQSYYSRGMSVNIHCRAQKSIPFPFQKETQDKISELGKFVWDQTDLIAPTA